MTLIDVAQELRAEVDRLAFARPVTHVYRPLDYAWAPHRAYIERFGAEPREIVLVGMNPGPWGMAQTGIPFGDVEMVRGWMGIEAPVGKPAQEHPRRPVLGFACPRSEVSGRRLWGWARATFGPAETFFRRFFVANYCPLSFLEETGRNRTPDKLYAAEREALFRACDRALRDTIRGLSPRFVLGVGRFAAQRIDQVCEGMPVARGSVPPPSPASPRANRDWAAQMTKALEAHGIALPQTT